MTVSRRRTDRIFVQHYWNGGPTVDSLAYFVKLCDEAGIPRKSQVKIHKNSETLGDSGLTADWYDSLELPDTYRPEQFGEEPQ